MNNKTKIFTVSKKIFCNEKLLVVSACVFGLLLSYLTIPYLINYALPLDISPALWESPITKTHAIALFIVIAVPGMFLSLSMFFRTYFDAMEFFAILKAVLCVIGLSMIPILVGFSTFLLSYYYAELEYLISIVLSIFALMTTFFMTKKNNKK